MGSTYSWKEFNKMKYNGDKFMDLRIGTYKIIENTMLFTPNFEDLIRIVDIAKDLEIMIDKNNT